MRLLSVSPRQRIMAVGFAVGIGTGVSAVALWPASADGAPTSAPAAPAAAVTVAPRANGAARQTPTDPSDEPTRASSPASAGTADPARLTLDQVRAIAVAAAPGRVVEIDEDDERTGLRYDVTIRHSDHTSTDLEIDAVTGKVLSIDHDDDWD